jgi:hypothetical protein
MAVETRADPNKLPTTVGMDEKNPPLVRPFITANAAKGARVVDAGHSAIIVNEFISKKAARVLIGPKMSHK